MRQLYSRGPGYENVDKADWMLPFLRKVTALFSSVKSGEHFIAYIRTEGTRTDWESSVLLTLGWTISILVFILVVNNVPISRGRRQAFLRSDHPNSRSLGFSTYKMYGSCHSPALKSPPPVKSPSNPLPQVANDHRSALFLAPGAVWRLFLEIASELRGPDCGQACPRICLTPQILSPPLPITR